MVLDFSAGERTDDMKKVLAILFLLPLAARRAVVLTLLASASRNRPRTRRSHPSPRRRMQTRRAVPQERRQMLVLDVETANLGSFCSRISMVECAHAIQRQGHRVLSVVLGADSRETPYL